MANRARLVRRIILPSVLIGVVALATIYVLRKVDEARAILATAEAARICTAVLHAKAEDCRAATVKFEADPWGRPYQCEMIGPQQARVTCLGKDGIPGGDSYDIDHVCEPKVVDDKKHCACHLIKKR